MVSRVYLDANIFIAAFEGRGTASDLSAALLLAPAGRAPQSPRLITSELTLSELLVKPLELERDDLVREYEYWTKTNIFLEVRPVDRQALRKAAELRATHKTLKLPDAIHLASAVNAGCRYFLTDDMRINVDQGVEIVRPTPVVLKRLIDEAE